MKTINATVLKGIGFFFLCTFSIGISFSQQDYKRVTGSYRIPGNAGNNGNTPVINCGCNSPGLLNYEAADGSTHTLILCFDTEPGGFYEIFDEEGISVEGNLRSVTCDDSELHEVLYVVKSEMEVLNRKELIPESIKKQSTSPLKK
ncbi:hypothetical protein [Fluviicola sp.]|uniref:hypothetical protein n=1 Tax=Fluviicola sp. TaxID=1917219 RepID=UPI0026378C98|nr:hypothetical protein [Fluviicola sp.]